VNELAAFDTTDAIDCADLACADGDPGNLANDPAHELASELYEVLTLLHAARQQCPGRCVDAEADDDNMTCAASRARSLMWMADQKVRSVIARIEP
jgi:hypothetical protein